MGLGNPVAVRELRKIVRQEVPALLFVMETKIRAVRVEALQWQLGFAGCFAVDSNGLSGGIGLFWSSEVSVELKNYSISHIDVMVRKSDDHNSPAWRLTGFYGAPRAENGHHSWRFMRTLYQIEHAAWICVGDFNETMFGTEHFSRSERLEWQMRAFRDVIIECSFQDLGWSGVPFTWDNGQQGEMNVKARLDRALVNQGFLQRFEHSRVRHLSAMESDHCFVMVDIREKAINSGHGKRQFRYENIWQSHVDYDNLVADVWRRHCRGAGLASIADTLSTLQGELGAWGARGFGCLAKKIKKLQRKLDKLRSTSMGRGPTDEVKKTVMQLREMLKLEEIWMRQRSRVPWLRDGDRNTKYFQAQATQRRLVNRISGLRRCDGSVCTGEKEDKEEIQSFYQSLFLSQGVNDMEALLQFIPNKVSPAMNEAIAKPYTMEEVHAALFQMAPSKAPGVDGLTAGFFQRHWNLIKEDLGPAILDFLHGGNCHWVLMTRLSR